MQRINKNDIKLKYPGFFNVHPIKNEVSLHSKKSISKNTDLEYYLDDNYGRIIDSNVQFAYGDSKSLNYFSNHNNWNIIESFRTPFRKIPIFQLDDISQIREKVKQLEFNNKSHEILLRGQTGCYFINREKQEFQYLYGDANCKEPSFHPSYLRTDFNEIFINSLWQNQIALMLNDVGIDLSKTLSEENMIKYYDDVTKIKGTYDFTPISLGYAQHYGMPSIGLDLTKDLKVALWFASNQLKTGNDGICTIKKLEDFSKSTIYLFSCPKDTVFSHKQIKPKFITNTRPDRQDAWFCHSGWGNAKNQLASYLVCGFRLNSSVLELFEHDFSESLFPSRKEDLVLNYFLEMRENKKGYGEVKRALDKIYYLRE